MLPQATALFAFGSAFTVLRRPFKKSSAAEPCLQSNQWQWNQVPTILPMHRFQMNCRSPWWDRQRSSGHNCSVRLLLGHSKAANVTPKQKKLSKALPGLADNHPRKGAPQLHVLRLPMQTPSKVGFLRAKEASGGTSSRDACRQMQSSAMEHWADLSELKFTKNLPF